MKIFHNKHGDTMVEVLLAITALSLVLSGAYVLANRSTIAYRQAQERGESQKVAQSQLEQLKQYLTAPDPTHGVPADGEVFCLNSSGGIINFPTATRPPVDAQAETFAAFAGSPANPTNDCRIGTFYHNYIVREGDVFTVHTRWASARGTGIEEATMVHRIYPDLVAQSDPGSISNPGCLENWYRASLGTCLKCPDNFTAPPGESTSCAPIPPKVIVQARRINPGPGNATPLCDSTSVGDRIGASVRLSGPSTINGSTTGTPSNAEFPNLLWGATYIATLVAAPSATNPESAARPHVVSQKDSPYVGTTYNTYSPSGGPSFSACPAPASISATTNPRPTMTAPAGAAQVITTNPEFKFRPNCYVRSVWVYENDPLTYYADTTRDAIYAWGVGLRYGGATDRVYPGVFHKNGYNDLGAVPQIRDLTRPDWVYEPADGLGISYYFYSDVNSTGHWYHTWHWNRYFTGEYGPYYATTLPYYHGQHWVEHKDASPTCP